MESKVCVWCGKEFLNQKGIGAIQFKGRKYCSRYCSDESRKKTVTKFKACVVCWKAIPHNGIDTNTVYNRRKTCSVECFKTLKATYKTTFKSGKDHPNWKGGTCKNKKGYVLILVGSKKYQMLHKLVMEEYLGRKLERYEVVHHCNEVTDDNRIINLELMTREEHSRLHGKKTFSRKSVKEKAAESRRGKFKKEYHSCWRADVTDNKIIEAVKKYRTKKEASAVLGICADTLRARINYMEN